MGDGWEGVVVLVSHNSNNNTKDNNTDRLGPTLLKIEGLRRTHVGGL